MAENDDHKDRHSVHERRKGTNSDYDDIEDLIERNRREMEAFVKTAVPNGDLKGHCDVHQDWMDRELAKDAYWKDIKKQITQSTIGGGIMFLIAWAALKFFGVHLS